MYYFDECSAEYMSRHVFHVTVMKRSYYGDIIINNTHIIIIYKYFSISRIYNAATKIIMHLVDDLNIQL